VRAADGTSALAPAAGASFPSRPASQRLVADEDPKLHFRQRRNEICSGRFAARTRGRHCEQGSGEANQGSERRRSFRTGYVKARQGAKGARRGWIATSPQPVGRRASFDAFALVQDDCSIASQQFSVLTFRTIDYILFIRKSPFSGDDLWGRNTTPDASSA
jgi:hypothetical protein